MFVACGIGLLLTLIPSPPVATPVPGRTQHLANSDQAPAGLAPSDWSSIRAAYEAGRRRICAVETGGHQALHPGQQWRTRFDGRGFLVEPLRTLAERGVHAASTSDSQGTAKLSESRAPADVAPAWQWGLELTAYGFPGHERALSHDAAAPQVDTDGARLAYAWDAGLREWFVNDARGLEHGFTVLRRPHGIPAEFSPLNFRLAVRGTLRPQITADAQGVQFRDAAGATIVNYTGLKVWDADGRVLPAHFATGKESKLPITKLQLLTSNEPSTATSTLDVGCSTFEMEVSQSDSAQIASHKSSVINLLVDDRGARYPLTIDPIAQQAYLKPAAVGTTQSGDNFGFSVAVSGDTVVVGAIREDSSTTGVNSTPNELATDSGAAYVFVRNGTTWTQQAYLKPAAVGTTQAGDNFGISVAISGDTVVVGAWQEDSNTTGVNSTPNDTVGNSGAAYIFVRSGTTWTQQAYLKPAAFGTWQANDQFGTSVAVSGDTVVVGAPLEDGTAPGVNSAPNDIGIDPNFYNTGAAYVFVRNGTTWTQQAYLKPSIIGRDQFGTSVAVSGDTVVVGAPFEDSSTTGVNTTPNELATDSGAAYVFTRSGTTWTEQAYLKPAAVGTTQAGDRFGNSVAVSGDTVTVGAPFEDSSTTGVNSTPNELATDSGAAYVFVRSGTTWTQQAYLKPAAIGLTQVGDLFGYSVAISGDTVVVGAWQENSSTTGVNSTPDDSSGNTGAAYVFTRSRTTWTQQAYLKQDDVGNLHFDDFFGVSVAVSGDTVVVGAHGEDSSTTGVNGTPNRDVSNSGAAYVFAGFGFTLAATDATYARAPGLSLKIPIADIASDSDVNSFGVQSLGASAQSATLSFDNTYIYYFPADDNNDSFTYTVTNSVGNTATKTLIVNVAAAGGIARSITAAGGTVTINFFGIPGFQYDLQRATSLGPSPPADWATLSNPTQTAAASDGKFSFENSPGTGTFFYRSIQH